MSVRTPADEKIDDAKDHIEKAYKCLLESIDSNTYGSEAFNKEYTATIEYSVISLLRLKSCI